MLTEILSLLKDKIEEKYRFHKTMIQINKGESPELLSQFIRYKAHVLDLAKKRGKLKNYKAQEKLLMHYIHLYESKYGYEESITWAKDVVIEAKTNRKDSFKQKTSSLLDEIIFKRKSIRKFLDKEIKDEILYKIIEVGIQAPIACNKQSLRFLIAKKEAGSINGIHSSKEIGLVEIPPVIIYIVNDDRFYSEKETALMTIGCVAENMVLKATELGIGSCLMHIGRRMRIKLRNRLGLKDYENIYLLICFGYPNEDPVKPYRCSLNRIVSLV